MNTKNAIKRLVESLGGQSRAAEALGVAQPTVNGWLNGRHGVSAIVAMKAERVTGGKVLASDLCPGLIDLTPAA